MIFFFNSYQCLGYSSPYILDRMQFFSKSIEYYELAHKVIKD